MDVPIFDIFYGPEEAHGASEMDQKSLESFMRVEGAPYPLGAPPYLVDDSETPPDVKSTPTSPINAQTSRK